MVAKQAVSVLNTDGKIINTFDLQYSLSQERHDLYMSTYLQSIQ